MKKSSFVLPAIALAGFGAVLALGIVNFEEGLAGETSQIDRWVMIFSFAGAAACIGLASADSSSSDGDTAASGAADAATGRAAAARKLEESRPDPTELPPKPGSLFKNRPTRDDAEAGLGKVALDIEGSIEAPVPDNAQPFADQPVDTNSEIAAVPQPIIDPVDAELQSLIDDDQMQEINELVAAADETDVGADVTDHAGDDPEVEDTTEIVPGSESVEPLARLELRLADYNDDDLKRVVKESESVVIAEMVRGGQLTSAGELTQQDIASMVFLAYTSDEMLAELRLRKAIDENSDQAGLEASTGNDFAPLKNIE